MQAGVAGGCAQLLGPSSQLILATVCHPPHFCFHLPCPSWVDRDAVRGKLGRRASSVQSDIRLFQHVPLQHAKDVQEGGLIHGNRDTHE